MIEDLPPVVAEEQDEKIDDLSPVSVRMDRMRFEKALTLTYCLLFLVGLVTLVILADWMWWGPSRPEFAGLTPDQARQVIENHNAMSVTSRDRAVSMFDAIVAESLIPLLATVIGFLIGRRVGS